MGLAQLSNIANKSQLPIYVLDVEDAVWISPTVLVKRDNDVLASPC